MRFCVDDDGGNNLPYHSVGILGDMLDSIQGSGHDTQVFGLGEPPSKLIGGDEVAVWPQSEQRPEALHRACPGLEVPSRRLFLTENEQKLLKRLNDIFPPTQRSYQ